MHIIEIDNGRDGYVNILEHVWDHGVRRVPRDMATIDAGPTTIIMRDVHNALPLGTGRGVNPKIAAIEAMQLIAGISVPDMVVRASPNFEKYREPDGTFYGAYGIRVGKQTEQVIRKLKEDRNTRQAVITLWNPFFDNSPGMHDYPCTVALHFDIRYSKLNMNVVMRSNDAWLGTPYDLFQFTQLQLTIARALCVNPGMYRHTAWSLHLYENNFDAVEEMISNDISPGDTFQPDGIGVIEDSWDKIVSMGRQLITGEFNDVEFKDLTDSEQWYDNQFKSIR